MKFKPTFLSISILSLALCNINASELQQENFLKSNDISFNQNLYDTLPPSIVSSFNQENNNKIIINHKKKETAPKKLKNTKKVEFKFSIPKPIKPIQYFNNDLDSEDLPPSTKDSKKKELRLIISIQSKTKTKQEHLNNDTDSKDLPPSTKFIKIKKA